MTPTLAARCFTALLCAALSLASYAAAPDDALATLARQWARINYQLPEKEQAAAFAALNQQARQLAAAHPDLAEPIVWQAITLANQAEIEGGLGALRKAGQARDLLLAAERIQPEVMHGAIYSTLGALYGKVPGWPISFGDKAKARHYFDMALKIDPVGMDKNYLFAEFLADNGDYAAALRYLDKAEAAPARPNREEADPGRRKEIAELRAEVQAKLGKRP